MNGKRLDRDRLRVGKLSERKTKIRIEKDHIPLSHPYGMPDEQSRMLVKHAAGRIKSATATGASRMIAFGAHTIKNGMAPVLIQLIKEGFVTHLATNGAGIIHDWEFAYSGMSSEDVRENVRDGKFGIWEETGFYINLALIVGAYEGLGYGEAVGKMIVREGLDIPRHAKLLDEARELAESDSEKASAAIDLASAVKKFGLKEGFMEIPHPWKKFSVQAAAWELGTVFTGHPMIGHDIIYNHPMNHGAAVGRCALRDFLVFAGGVLNLENGIYISVGSAVMSPMIFEKALSMAQNIKISENNHIDNHYMIVVDLAKSGWDWKKSGEPPSDNPAYYLRNCKTFARMGGQMDYLSADNRDFLLALYNALKTDRQ